MIIDTIILFDIKSEEVNPDWLRERLIATPEFAAAIVRFNTFTGDPAARKDLRDACQDMARLVGSSRVIYTHELMPHEGQGLLQIETGLRERIGPPADTNISKSLIQPRGSTSTPALDTDS